MGKPKKNNMAPGKNKALEQQLMEGKIAKQKDRKKIHIRAEESSASYNANYKRFKYLIK